MKAANLPQNITHVEEHAEHMSASTVSGSYRHFLARSCSQSRYGGISCNSLAYTLTSHAMQEGMGCSWEKVAEFI